jgi:methionyl-tRNA synthetase
LPETSDKILSQLNTEETELSLFNGLKVGTKLNTPVPLFNRIDKDKAQELLQK